MKKLITSLIVIGLVTNSMAVAIMSPKRFAQCIWDPAQYGCTEKERTEAKIWVATVSVGTIISVLALIGVTLHPQAAQKFKIYQAEKDIDDAVEQLAQQMRDNLAVIAEKREALVRLESQLAADRNNEQIKNDIKTLQAKIAQLNQNHENIKSDIANRRALLTTIGKN